MLDFVANVEDEFDVIITMNMQAEIETVGQLVDALQRLTAERQMTDLFSKFDPTSSRCASRCSRPAVTDPFNLVMEKVESPTVAICNGKRTILLGTYNYMGMTFDPDVVAAGKQALDEFGSGTTGSRVLNGTYAGHRAVEEALKDFYGDGPCDGLLDRLPGQSRGDFDDRRQG